VRAKALKVTILSGTVIASFFLAGRTASVDPKMALRAD
jgi:hypothetical protein